MPADPKSQRTSSTYPPRTTREAAERLTQLLGVKVPPYSLTYLVCNGIISSPTKNGSGDLVWSPADIEHARAALAARRAKAKAKAVAHAS
jgi:hypothetical protein